MVLFLCSLLKFENLLKHAFVLVRKERTYFWKGKKVLWKVLITTTHSHNNCYLLSSYCVQRLFQILLIPHKNLWNKCNNAYLFHHSIDSIDKVNPYHIFFLGIKVTYHTHRIHTYTYTLRDYENLYWLYNKGF